MTQGGYGTSPGVSGDMPSDAVRVRLGASPSAGHDVLLRLAGDPSVTVRAALAMNPSAPPEADVCLATDADERVRALLASRLATLAPGLAAPERTALKRHARETLGLLVQDAAVRVRSAIAEVVKEMPDAPRDLILRLAYDTELPVSGPVIRFSPLLTGEDLLALVADSPDRAAAVASRANIGADVCDAVVAGADSTVIRTLLGNRSAQIRDATLDALIARAEQNPGWHPPLVRRPRLPAHSALALSGIVATCLLAEMADRAGLDAGLVEEMRRRIAARLGGGPPPARPDSDASLEEAIDEARTIAAAGKIPEKALIDAATRGEARRASALLAVAASVPVRVVDRAVRLRSAKGLVSLAWRAGFTMMAGCTVQTLLAHLSPDAVLSAGPGGRFPLATDEMNWQIDFLSRAGR